MNMLKVPSLVFLRRPAIRLGAGATHQHRPFTVAETVRLPERFDGPLVADDRERARPVGAPETALETPGVEHASERVPDIREGIRFQRQGAGAADLDYRVL